MSIASRMKMYDLYRADSTLDDYGIMSSTPALVSAIYVSITKNNPTHENNVPLYATTPYIGITKYVGVQVGDLLNDEVNQYQVKDMGNRGTMYQPLFLEKLT